MAETKPGKAVYDLGSEDCRIIITATREFHARSVGVEINPLWVLWTQLRIDMLKLEEQVEVVWGDFFREDLGEADVVAVFLKQDTNDRLRPKLEREMKQGARVVSYTCPFTGWNPLKVDLESEIFVYRIGTER